LVKFSRTTTAVNITAGVYVNDTLQGGSEAEASYPISGESGIMRGFAFVSWQRTKNSSADGTNTTLTVALLIQGVGRYFCTATKPGLPSLERREDPSVFFYPYYGMSLGYWYVGMGEYVSDPHEIIALSKFGTHFPVSAIGYRKDFTLISGSYYIDNENVTISALTLANDKRPGRIRWSNGGAIPEMFERNVFQEIMRIMPVKSYMPTDEHNTLLIWTKDKLLRMSLSGDNKAASSLITEIKGVGLQSRYAIAQVDGGIVWSEGTGIYFLTPGELKVISKDRINIGSYTVLFNSVDREILFINSTGNARVYKIDNDFWSLINYGITATAFMTFEDKWCLICGSGAYELWPEDDDTTLTPLIRTRKIPARRKWKRITLHSSGGTVKALVHNHRLSAGYTTTPEYALTGDDPCGIPGLSGDFIQLEIETDNIKSFDIEVNDGQ
ncbi:MAG TPA: hypothetical protein PL124_11095, partial [Candidatus Cloacimonadota bacterium]|nr:hypothetical protein [Candidatus Cloacimonadota bacterium]